MDPQWTRPEVLSATTLIGDQVVNTRGEDLGKLEEIMIDLFSGRVAYAVLSFGGFLGIGSKLFAIPWSALTVNTRDKNVVLDIEKSVLENAPGFDKDNWPKTTDENWLIGIYEYYGFKPYWRE
ncbi:MAG TPA: PRC-barrel domain-containing protein [Anaerolineaceae bacterium]|nr:PRC-barrel domain-containing protein [Anaerolineaceae bacterium]